MIAVRLQRDAEAHARALSVPPNAPKVNYKRPGFLTKFLELQQVMWTTNAGLTDRHTFDSRPDSWPRLRRGIVSDFMRSRLYVLFDSNHVAELLGEGSPSNLSSWQSHGMVAQHSIPGILRRSARFPDPSRKTRVP